jgi:HD-GYP domain-containing protein (c-di-GMP phosphodiesterase class II)
VAAARSKQITDGYSRANCEVAALTARRVGLGEGVERGLGDVFEWWNGKGGPAGLSGHDVSLQARVAQVASVGGLFDQIGGPELAVAEVSARAGRSLDPAVAAAFCSSAGDLLRELSAVDVLSAAVAAEPAPAVRVSGEAIDEVCRAFGEAVDLKSPFHHGHSTGVAALSAGAAARLGLEVVPLRRAAFLHDIGRAAVPNGVWEKAGPLTSSGWERVRLHAYQSERILSRCAPLAACAQLAGMHHERLDGSGYHRAASGAGTIPLGARVLAAADAFVAATQERAHRRAMAPEAAAASVGADASAGRLDADAVRAVVEAAGERAPRAALAAARPGGLTDRQVEVLRLLARGLSNPEIARELVVSRRTAEHHVQDIYARIGVSSRAAAALFAMEHDLLA